MCVYWRGGGTQIICHLLDIDIYSSEHNGGKRKTMDLGGCRMMKMNSFSERQQMVRLACWHSATSEHCFQTSLKY